MSEVRPLAPEIIEQVFDLLRDETLLVQPFAVQYQSFSITADSLRPLDRTNAATYQLRRGSADVGQWTNRYPTVRVLLRRKGSKLEQAFQYPHGWRDVVYDLGSAYQTDSEVLIGFRMVSGSAGRNRWFGRRDGKVETRTLQDMEMLAAKLRQELGQVFTAQNPASDTGLPAQWLTVARLPLTTPATLAATPETKTQLLRQLAQALVVGEVLRRASFEENLITSSVAEPRMMHPLNQILYGPPGTGKTYSTTAWALALLNTNNLPVAEIEAHYGGNEDAMRQAFEQYRQQGQIGFVSFHQSFGYEDFVEGIKPVLADAYEADEGATGLNYRIEAGIFKAMAEQAIYGLHLQRQARLFDLENEHQADGLKFDVLFDLFANSLKNQMKQDADNVNFLNKSKIKVKLKKITEAGDMFVYSKYSDADTAVYKVEKKYIKSLYNKYLNKHTAAVDIKDIRDIVSSGNPSMYWAVFNALKMFENQHEHELSEQSASVSSLSDELRSALAQPRLAAKVACKFDFTQLTPEDYAQAPRFVLIIDEINRGNVASIFGELISLLEDDKRGGQPHELRVTLPYSKESFVVPPNLYVLGTMNTADRSVEALDTALRRRFSFHELAPQPQLLRTDVEGVNLPQLLIALNERLETLLDRDHRLGHAWLMPVRELAGLRAAFSQKVIPQLQEYFHGHWGRIGQVLGTGFVRRKATTVALMSGFSDEDGGEEISPRYEITPAETWSVEVFQSIYR